MRRRDLIAISTALWYELDRNVHRYISHDLEHRLYWPLGRADNRSVSLLRYLEWRP